MKTIISLLLFNILSLRCYSASFECNYIDITKTIVIDYGCNPKGVPRCEAIVKCSDGIQTRVRCPTVGTSDCPTSAIDCKNTSDKISTPVPTTTNDPSQLVLSAENSATAKSDEASFRQGPPIPPTPTLLATALPTPMPQLEQVASATTASISTDLSSGSDCPDALASRVVMTTDEITDMDDVWMKDTCEDIAIEKTKDLFFQFAARAIVGRECE